MFTGIIAHLGKIVASTLKQNLLIVDIDLGPLARDVKKGDSVAINGVCLTVTNKKGTVARFDLMKETIERTSLKGLETGDKVNLELALRVGDRLGGHVVSGHVDAVAVIKEIQHDKNWVAMRLSMNANLRRYFVPKGSVTVDGISLTVGRVTKQYFEVYLIPYTLHVTNLGLKKPGDRVNIETDILAKYLFHK